MKNIGKDKGIIGTILSTENENRKQFYWQTVSENKKTASWTNLKYI